MPKRLNLLGQRFGRLVVIENSYKNARYQQYWKCYCDPKYGGCGNIVDICGSNLTSGSTRSCGCLNRETGNYVHNLSNHRLMGIFSGMQQRCYNPKHMYYYDYGGRGIYICDEWYKPGEKGNPGFINFYNWSYNNGYYDQPKNTPKRELLTIDRIDHDGPYAPWNCRWIPLKFQGSNKSNNRETYIDGIRYTDAQLARKYNVSREYIKHKRYAKWSTSAILYALEHPELKIHKWKGGIGKNKKMNQVNNTYLDKDGFQILIPKIYKEEPK